MNFKLDDKLVYVGGYGWDLTVAPEPDQTTDVQIIRDGDGGWDWWVRNLDSGDEFMADECQLREKPEAWKRADARAARRVANLKVI